MKQKAVMIRVATSIAIAVLVLHTAAFADPPNFSLSDHPSQDGRCIGDKGSGDLDRSEMACLAQIGDLARRDGPSLRLRFRNGLTRVYVDEDEKCRSNEVEGCVKYQLAGYFPDRDLLLIETDYSEGASWLLVRAATGDTSKIVSPPHYSPSKRWLVSVASSIGPSGGPNGVDIVPAARDPALKEWHYRIAYDDSRLYGFAGWDGDDRVKLLATSTEAPAKRKSVSIERRNGTWRFTRPK